MKLNKRIYFIAGAGWTISIAVLSLISLSGTSGIKSTVSDKLVHAVFYLVFVIFWYLYLRNRTIRNLLLKIVLFSIIYGIVIEILQGIMPFNRKPEIKDVLANAIGSLVAAILIKIYLIRLKIALKKRN